MRLSSLRDHGGISLLRVRPPGTFMITKTGIHLEGFETGRFTGFLNRHIELNDIQKELQQQLILPITPPAWRMTEKACHPSARGWGQRHPGTFAWLNYVEGIFTGI